MRVFKTGNNIMLYKKDEIHLSRACARHTQAETSEVTSCNSENCYSLNNAECDFIDNMFTAVAEKFDEIKNENFDEIKDETYNSFNEEERFCEIIKELNNKIDLFELETFVAEYIAENEEHSDNEYVYTGNNADIYFLESHNEEITDDPEGYEIIANFKKAGHQGTEKGFTLYAGEKYNFAQSHFGGDCAGYIVEIGGENNNK